MARKCTICGHPERAKIEMAIVDNAELRGIARTFSVSEDALSRHKRGCIKAAIKEVKQSQLIQSGSLALDRMARGEKVVDEILDAAWGDEIDKRSPELALKTLAELRRQVELRAKLEGELDEHSITVTSIPEWRELRTLLLEALSIHPQAKMAVIRALEAYEQGA